MRTPRMASRRRITPAGRAAAVLLLSLAAVRPAGAAAPAHVGRIPCLSGFVRDPDGRPVANGDLDVFDAAGVKVALADDNSDRDGFYSVCAAPGSYRVTFAPPPGTRLVGKELFDVDLRTSREMNVTLDTGSVFSGVVRLPDGGTLAAVDVDLDRQSGGRLFTPGDVTDAGGAYRVVVPDGVYRVRYSPPPAARWRAVQLDTVRIRGDRAQGIVLEPGVWLAGSVRAPSGSPLASVGIDVRRADGSRVFAAHNRTGADGGYRIVVPTGTFTLRFTWPATYRFVGREGSGFGGSGERDGASRPLH